MKMAWLTGGTGLVMVLMAVVLMAHSAPGTTSHQQPRTTSVVVQTTKP